MQAPLGWVLSDESIADLQEQLTANAGQIRRLRAWLDGRALPAGADVEAEPGAITCSDEEPEEDR